MTDGVTNVQASVHDRLLNIARRDGLEFEYVLLRYANERLLYRLSRSAARDQFVLKGAMVFMVWGTEVARQSRDIDLLGLETMASERLGDVFRLLCGIEVEDDGLHFDADSVRVEEIREQTEYGGGRVRLIAYLGTARANLQIDIGFGDVVSPDPVESDLPTFLDFPAARLRTYPRETVIAEKFEAIVRLGVTNTRLKDFYDLWSLARSCEFDATELSSALRATFERRLTAVPVELPLGLLPEFASQAEPQWRAFCRRIDFLEPPALGQVTSTIQDFLMPICIGLRSGNLPRHWTPLAGWI